MRFSLKLFLCIITLVCVFLGGRYSAPKPPVRPNVTISMEEIQQWLRENENGGEVRITRYGTLVIGRAWYGVTLPGGTTFQEQEN